MQTKDRFSILFEPVRIGPVTAPNRFYQVPHCTGMGYQHPATLAAMRGIKAEGGWGVVNTEYCSIHPSSDDLPAPFCSLWDEGDVRNMAAMVEAVHKHGSLAGVELWYGGMRAANHHSRSAVLAPNSSPVSSVPWQSQRMEKDDIRRYRDWHRAAVKRALQAGFDIIYVYAAHSYLLGQFLDPDLNQRTDEYGGSATNRQRLYREVIADTRELVDGKAALATRIEVTDENGGGREERAELLKSIAPAIDLFDVTIPDYSHEMGASRFIREGSLERDVAHVKQLTGKPVVSVGRFTSPETMLYQVKRGIIDFIGAARPSIADPFLPKKIREGRLDDIRECIGCNICYANDGLGVPIRCTQNPTMGEEWRRGWHPERVTVIKHQEPVLIVGGGPAGLEAAVTLGRRGVPVMLADKRRQFGGRVTDESRLPGLAEWARVRDWRVGQLARLPNVEQFLQSEMQVDDVIATDAQHVLIATGATWRKDGVGRSRPTPIASFNDPRTRTPENIMAADEVSGSVVIYDDDHYYMASVLAELLAREGASVTYVTSASIVGPFMSYTVEQARAQTALMKAGVQIIASHQVSNLLPRTAELTCVYTGKARVIPCETFVPVTSREPNDALFKALRATGLKTLHRIGDCKAPGLIAHAVYDGHRMAQEIDKDDAQATAKRERVVIDSPPST